MHEDIDKEKAVFEHLRHHDAEEQKAIRKELEDAGYDPDALAAEGASLAAGMIAAAREADEDFEIPEDLDAAIKDILAGKMGTGPRETLRVYWRNFEKATREDKIRILKDIRLLEAIKKKIETDEEGG